MFSVQWLFINLFVPAVMLVRYVGQTHQHLTTRTDEHFGKVKKSHVYQHLMSSAGCLNACSSDCFSILYTARTKHQLRIKESLFISWLNPTLNEQKNSLTNATFLCPFDLPFPPCYNLFYFHTPFQTFQNK